VGIPDLTIRGPSDVIMALSDMPLWTKLGLPIAPPRDKAAKEVQKTVMTAMKEGRFHIYGAAFHPGMLMRLTRVMSVNG
jgi:hypothetical protein